MPHAAPLVNILKEVAEPKPIVVKMPAGDSNLLPQIQMESIGITVVGCLFLLREMWLKSSEPALKLSKFN